MPIKVPDPIRRIFDPHPIKSENIILDTESGRRPKAGTVQVRALDGFLFVKNGRFVYPTYNKPEDWWTGVVAYGYTAGLTGDFKYFIWAGQWDQEFEGKHMEVVRLEKLLGIQKETNRHWRNGMEAILWLETAQGKSYALLEPAEEYDRGNWIQVTDSWTSLPHGESQADPAFSRIEPDDERPDWWIKAGDKAWNHLVKPLKEEMKRKEQVNRKRAENIRGQAKDTDVSKGKSKREGEGQGINQGRDAVDTDTEHGAGASIVKKRKRLSGVSTSTHNLRKRKKVSYVEVSSPLLSSSPSSPIDRESDPPESQDGSSSETSDPQPALLVDLKEDHLSANPIANACPDEDAVEVRLQAETNERLPGPNIQANTQLPSNDLPLPSFTADSRGENGEQDEACVESSPPSSAALKSSSNPTTHREKDAELDSAPSSQEQHTEGGKEDQESWVPHSSSSTLPDKEMEDLTIVPLSSAQDPIQPTPGSFPEIQDHKETAPDSGQMDLPSTASAVPAIHSPGVQHSVTVIGSDQESDLDNRSSRHAQVTGDNK